MIAGDHNYDDLALKQVGHQLGHTLHLVLGKPVFDRQVLALDEAHFTETLPEISGCPIKIALDATAQISDARVRPLLHAPRAARSPRAAEERDDSVPLHVRIKPRGPLPQEVQHSTVTDGGTGSPDARATLISKVVAVMTRLLDRPRIEADAPAATPAPTAEPTPRPSLAQRIADVLAPRPQPQPEQATQYPTIRAEGSNAQLIPDEEFSPRFRDPVTQAWKDSIAENVRLFPERRGKPKSSIYIG